MFYADSFLGSATSAVLLLIAACTEEPERFNANRNVSPPTAADRAANLQPAQPQRQAQSAAADPLAETSLSNASGEVPCGVAGAIEEACDAAVIRDWSDDGTILVEVTKPDGGSRALFFNLSGTPVGADSAEADGSAAWTLNSSRRGDLTVISYGPEQYHIPDALLLGARPDAAAIVPDNRIDG